MGHAKYQCLPQQYGIFLYFRSSWLGTQEDRDDFVTLSDDFIRSTMTSQDDGYKDRDEEVQEGDQSEGLWIPRG